MILLSVVCMASAPSLISADDAYSLYPQSTLDMEPAMKELIRFIGLDVHKGFIAMAVVDVFFFLWNRKECATY